MAVAPTSKPTPSSPKELDRQIEKGKLSKRTQNAMEREVNMELLPKDSLRKKIIMIVIGHALALVLLELLLLYVTWSL